MKMRNLRTGIFAFMLGISSVSAWAEPVTSQIDPTVQVDSSVLEELQSDYQKRFAEEVKKVDESFLIRNPIENQVAPLTRGCEKTLLSIFSACSSISATSRCDNLMKRFEKSCIVPPPPKKKDKEEKRK